MMPTRAQIVVVGSGPAGLAAAVEASRAGAQVVVLDEQVAPGGQYLRRRYLGAPDLRGAVARRPHDLKARLLRELSDNRVEIRTETTVWGAFARNILALHARGTSQLLRYERLVVATGAYDRPVAFPGWTLPGVFTAGGAQALIKGYGVLPGRRVLLSGSGPFLLPVAEELVRGGAEVVGVLEATRPAQWWSKLRHAWRYRDRAQEAIHYLRTLRGASVPVRFGRVVAAARGDDCVQEAVIARVDDGWRLIPGGEDTVAVDAICVGYGFLPSTELTRSLGLEHRFDPLRGGWLPVHDAEMQTTRAGVFVAGETAGLGSAEVALESGRLAGIAAARSLGCLSPAAARARAAAVQPHYLKARTFADLMLRIFALRPGIFDLATEETVICRCEEVTAGHLRARVRDWRYDLQGIKGALRTGMGLCQGRICGRLIAGLVAHDLGTDEEELGIFSARPPLKAVPMGVLAEMSTDEGGDAG